jgi:hypothetical protein
MLIFAGVLLVVASRTVFEFMTVPAICYASGILIMHALMAAPCAAVVEDAGTGNVMAAIRPADALDCPICLAYAAEPAALVCGHAFHAACITLWLSARGTCPMCRRAVCL